MASNKNHAAVRSPWQKDLQTQLDDRALLLGGTIGDIASQPQTDGVIGIQPSAALPNNLTEQQTSRLIQAGQTSDQFTTSTSDSDWLAVDTGGRSRGLSSATVLSPWATVNGRSQSDLTVDWWQRVYSIPAANHFGLFDDASDPRGRRGSVEKAAQGQLDNGSLALVGAFGELASKPQADGVIEIQRSIVLPNQGKSTVFLPILNGSFDNLVNPDPEDPQDPDKNAIYRTGAELQASIGEFFNPDFRGGQVSNLFAFIDGKRAVPRPLSLLNFRQRSDPFSYTSPYPVTESLLSKIGYTEETYLPDETYVPGTDPPPLQLKDLAEDGQLTIGPAVSDGYWLAVDVRGGAHDLRFGGALGDEKKPFFSLDVTYHLLNPIDGTQQKDILTGSGARDYLDGGESGDWLFGGKGDDLLIGGNGDDVLDGGLGSDELWGDAGRDIFLFRRGGGADTIFDFSAGDQVRIPGLKTPPVVKEVVLASGVGTQIDFGQGDTLTFTALGSNQLLLQEGLIVHV